MKNDTVIEALRAVQSADWQRALDLSQGIEHSLLAAALSSFLQEGVEFVAALSKFLGTERVEVGLLHSCSATADWERRPGARPVGDPASAPRSTFTRTLLLVSQNLGVSVPWY